MARGVEVDPEAAGLGRLVLVHGRSRREHGRLGVIDVRDGEVEVELLRPGALGPGRRLVVLHLLEGQTDVAAGVLVADAPAGRLQGHPVVVGGLDAPAEDFA